MTDEEIIANKFNNHFINVTKSLLKDVGETNSKYQNCLKNLLNGKMGWCLLNKDNTII